MRPVTEEQLRGAFVNATDAELARLPLPGLHETIWEDREFLGWRDMQAARHGYVAHWRGDRLVGVVVRVAPGGLKPGIAAMCAICHSTQPATQVRMFSARRAGARGAEGSTLGTYLCEDLGCSHLIRMGPPHLVTPRRIAERGQALLTRLASFTARVEEP